MHRSTSPLRLLTIAALATVLLLPAAASETATEIRECVRGNAPDTTSTQRIDLSSVDRAGGRRLLQARLLWKKHGDGHVRLNIHVTDPLDLRGSSYLVIENEPQDTVYAYLPAMARSRRIAGGGGRDIWSTDFSYEDIRLLQMRSGHGDAERRDDDEVAGRPTWVLYQLTDPARESGYEHTVSWVDKKTCVALKTEYYETGATPRKRLLVDPATLTEIDGKWIARDLEMTDLRDETRSWITVTDVTMDEKLSARHFNIGQYWGR